MLSRPVPWKQHRAICPTGLHMQCRLYRLHCWLSIFALLYRFVCARTLPHFQHCQSRGCVAVHVQRIGLCGHADASRRRAVLPAGRCVPTGGVLYATPGTYTFTVPYNVYTVHAVLVGGGGSSSVTAMNTQGGGGGGGALAWSNNIAVTPGATLTVVAGGPGSSSTFLGITAGGGGGGSAYGSALGAAGGVPSGHQGGGSGGAGGTSNGACRRSGGGGGAGVW